MISCSWGCSLSLLEVWARHDEYFCEFMSSQCGPFDQHISCLSQTRFGRNLIPVPPLLSKLCNAQLIVRIATKWKIGYQIAAARREMTSSCTHKLLCDDRPEIDCFCLAATSCQLPLCGMPKPHMCSMVQ